jgi:hypothetical protein
MEKRIWSKDETFKAEVQIAHFGTAPLTDQVVSWQLINAEGEIEVQGSFPPQEIAIGNQQIVGTVEFTLQDLKAAQKYRLVIGLDGTAFENDWDVWVFDPQVDSLTSEAIHITGALDEAALAELSQGGKVLYLPPAEDVRVSAVIGFSSIFWNTAWTKNQEPHTLGILCDPQHPVFERFPTEYHSNWQWWELIHGAAAMQMEALPPALRPLVQPIDTWFENRRLGLLFETKVGNGKLVVCSMDLSTDLKQRLAARQMRQSLVAYMESDAFAPGVSLKIEQVLDLFQPRDAETQRRRMNSASDKGNPLKAGYLFF